MIVAAAPGGPVVGFSIGAVALKVGGGSPQVYDLPAPAGYGSCPNRTTQGT
jgi:hypothetical protein